MPKPRKYREPTITREEKRAILNFFNFNGLTLTSWAKDRGFTPTDCFNVVYGNSPCIRGKKFQVAKQLKEFALQGTANG